MTKFKHVTAHDLEASGTYASCVVIHGDDLWHIHNIRPDTSVPKVAFLQEVLTRHHQYPRQVRQDGRAERARVGAAAGILAHPDCEEERNKEKKNVMIFSSKARMLSCVVGVL